MDRSEFELEYPKFRSRLWPQVLAAVVANIGTFGLGTVLGWSAIAIPQLTENHDFGKLSSDHLSWIDSVAILGGAVSAPAAGLLCYFAGRRGSIVSFALPFLLGWALVGFANNLETLYVGRFITGLAGGSALVTTSTYVFEVSERRIRRRLGSIMILMLASGMLFAYTLGGFLPWRTVSLISGVIPILSFLGMMLVPESPRYLFRNGYIAEASNALQWFHGSSNFNEFESRFKRLRRALTKEREGSSGVCRDLLKLSALKPAMLGILLLTFLQASGTSVIYAYYTNMAGIGMSYYMAIILIGIAQVFSVLISLALVGRIGLKFLLTVSYIIMGLSLFGLGACIFFEELKITDSQGWILFASIGIFIIACGIGPGNVTWLLLEELLPPRTKEFSKALVIPFYWTAGYFATTAFYAMARIIGWYGSFWVLGMICIWAAAFACFAIPTQTDKQVTATDRDRRQTNPTFPSYSFESNEVVLVNYQLINPENPV